MIIEMRTYRLKPGSVPEAEKRFGEGLKERVRVSPLGAFFHTEVGPLNRIIHCWPYEDLAHRAKVRSEKIPGWPPKIQEFIEEMESKIIIAAPFSPKLEPRKLGNLYEIRTYTMLPGATPTVVDWRGGSGRPANARVLHKIDADGFYALLCERLARLPSAG